jgi:hypothetical protein
MPQPTSPRAVVDAPEAVVVSAHPILGVNVALKDGPLDRLYGLGIDPAIYSRNPRRRRARKTGVKHRVFIRLSSADSRIRGQDA